MGNKIWWSPWGEPQTVEKVADGIFEITTAGHGGIRISQIRFDSMPPSLKSIQPFAQHLWYEEDCDWAIPFLSFPKEFNVHLGKESFDLAYKAALKTMEHYHPEAYNKFVQEKIHA